MIGRTVSHYRIVEKLGGWVSSTVSGPDVRADARGEHPLSLSRRLLPGSALTVGLALAPLAAAPQPTEVHAAMGILVGEVTDSSALVQVRLTASDGPADDGDVAGAPGVVELTLEEVGQGSARSRRVVTVAAAAEHDFIARAAFTGLSPGRSYVCSTRIGASARALRPGPTARFRTLPGPGSAVSVRFVVVTGMSYGRYYAEPGADPRGYPALAAILERRPDFFVGTGDNVYYDFPREGRAETLDEMRRKWHEQFVQERYRELFAATPTFWMIDDHDFRVDDCDNTGDYAPSPELARRVMLEQLPYAPMEEPDPVTYRTHHVSRDLQIWLPEGRLYRSPNAMPDGPVKTIWGSEQRAWLQRTLSESDAAFKLLVSPTPMVGPDDRRKTDNHTNVGGFQAERDAFFAWLVDTGLDDDGFYILCGDRHWQYHSIHPSGIEEFSSGALVDANARLGRRPGDPASTDPDALIDQPYTQAEVSGGFLEVLVARVPDGPIRLELTWRDEGGEVLHRTRKERPSPVPRPLPRD